MRTQIRSGRCSAAIALEEGARWLALADLGRQDGGLSVQVQPDQEVDFHGRGIDDLEVQVGFDTPGCL